MLSHTFSNEVRGTRKTADFKISIQCQGFLCSLAFLSVPALNMSHCYKIFIHTNYEIHSATATYGYPVCLYFSWVLKCLRGPLWQRKCPSPDSQEGGVISLRPGEWVLCWALYAWEHLESAEHRIWCTSSFLPCPRNFPKGNKIYRTSAYLVWSWHWIKAPWEAHQETRRNAGFLKCVCCHVQ